MSGGRRVVFIACALAIATLGGWWAARLIVPPPRAVALLHGTMLVPPRRLGSIDLVDQRGRQFTNQQLLGRWSVVYFGFTHCPVVCPTTMAVLKDFARRVAGLPASARPQVILITVDPERDSPQELGRYVESFDPAFLGLTGKGGALDAVAAEFSVAHGPAGPDGSMDHSTAIYLVDPQGALAAVFTSPHDAAALAEDYSRLAAG